MLEANRKSRIVGRRGRIESIPTLNRELPVNCKYAPSTQIIRALRAPGKVSHVPCVKEVAMKQANFLMQEPRFLFPVVQWVTRLAKG